jgi:hypothetical protein
MSSRNAWFWALSAATMLLVLVAYERLFHRPPPGPQPLLPGFTAAAVDSIRVLPADGEEIRVERTNDAWRLTKPVPYPAQTISIEALLQALEEIIPATRISSAQLRKTDEDRAAFGLETPRASLVLTADGGHQQLQIGSLTGPGDQVFVQVVGLEGIQVIDAELLKLVPTSNTAWRDTSLCTLADDDYDGLLVTTPESVLELRREATNQTWRIVRPMQARADAAHLETLVQGLRDLRVERFVSDDPRADRQAWGLQPPELQIVFSKGTNTLETLQFGNAVETADDQVHAVGREPGTVVTVPSTSLQAWRATPNEFRDRQILNLPRAVASIGIGNGSTFTVVSTTNGTWRVEPPGIPADPVTVQRFVDAVQSLRAAQFVKDVVAEPDLPEYGLAQPKFRVSFTFKPGSDGQSPPPIGLDFGIEKDGLVYTRRTDENAVYGVDVEELATLPAAAGHFRQLALWDFPESQVASLTLQKGEATWEVRRNGQNQWSVAPGSQGMVNAFAVEEAAHRLGGLSAVVWTDWGEQDPALYGLGPEALSLTVELKDGGRKTVQFGYPAPSSHVYASTVLEGQPWVFEFPSETFNLVDACLITPSKLR